RGAVLLRGDREIDRQVVDAEVVELELDAAGGTRVGLHHAGGVDGGLLGDALAVLPGLGRDVGLAHHALHDAAAVSQLQEGELAAPTLVCDPAAAEASMAALRE